MNVANPDLGSASFGNDAAALGIAWEGGTTGVVSLGDGGAATLGFASPISDGPGFDLAVFENSFTDSFLELAFVEVSSNGTDFFRFPSVSLTQATTQVGGFGALDATDLHNLAGKYRGGYGTPFDLSELRGVSPLLDVGRVIQVRIVDVVGCIDPLFAAWDSLGNIVNDPWSTPFASSGFDLDAVGVFHVAGIRPKVLGNLYLEDYVGDVPSVVEFEFREHGSPIVIETAQVQIGASGSFEVDAPGMGVYDLSVKVSHWLRQTVAVDSSDGDVAGVSLSLANGDVDLDNAVTVFDYAILSGAFDTAPGDVNWNDSADLDGDGAVTVFDYAVLSTSFDRAGDE